MQVSQRTCGGICLSLTCSSPIKDLIDVKENTLVPLLRDVLQQSEKHIRQDCELCKAKGFFCELCREDRIIYPFDLDTTVCPGCSCVFHAMYGWKKKEEEEEEEKKKEKGRRRKEEEENKEKENIRSRLREQDKSCQCSFSFLFFSFLFFSFLFFSFLFAFVFLSLPANQKGALIRASAPSAHACGSGRRRLAP